MTIKPERQWKCKILVLEMVVEMRGGGEDGRVGIAREWMRKEKRMQE